MARAKKTVKLEKREESQEIINADSAATEELTAAIMSIVDTYRDEKTLLSIDEALEEAFPAAKSYVALKFSMAHPFQKKYLEVGMPVQLELDSWLESQINAGIVKEV